MKYSFFEHLSAREQKAKLQCQMESARQKIKEYEDIRKELLARNLAMHKLRIVDFGIETQKLKIRWAKEMLKDLNRRGAVFGAAHPSSSPTHAFPPPGAKPTKKKG
jgi:TRAP-type C4-dicarboxylate transport system substrate-binding protein